MKQLNDAGKQELALALVLWKDFKSDGKMDIDISLQMFSFAKHLGIQKRWKRCSANYLL